MTPFQLCHFFVKADKELIKLRGTHGDKYHDWYKALGEHAQVASYESFSARELTTKQALDLLLVFKTACAPGHPASMAVTALASVIEKKRSDEEESRLAFRSSAPAASDSPDTQRQRRKMVDLLLERLRKDCTKEEDPIHWQEQLGVVQTTQQTCSNHMLTISNKLEELAKYQLAEASGNKQKLLQPSTLILPQVGPPVYKTKPKGVDGATLKFSPRDDS